MRKKVLASVLGSLLSLVGKQHAQADVPLEKVFKTGSPFPSKSGFFDPKDGIVLAAHRAGHRALPLPSLSLVRRSKVENNDTAHFVYVLFGKRGTPEVAATAKRALELACAWNGLGKISDRNFQNKKKRTAKSKSLNVKLKRKGAIVLPITVSQKKIEDGTELWKSYDTAIASDVLNALRLNPNEVWLVYSEEPLIEFIYTNPGMPVDFNIHADLISGVSDVFLSSRFEATMALVDDEEPFEYRRLEEYLAMLENGLSIFDKFALTPPAISIGGPEEPEAVCQVN